MEYQCPQCKALLHWSSKNKYRPFCSQRCQQVDLLAWSQDEYVIASQATQLSESSETVQEES